MDRYRNKPKRQYAPIDVPEGVEFDLDVVAWTSATHRYLAERAARDGIQTTIGPMVEDRAVDAPLRGRVAIMPKDEREARHNRPLVYADFSAGKVPVLIANAAAYHLEECRDWVAEMRHYGEDAIEDEPMPDMQAEWMNYLALRRAVKAGRHTYGAATRGAMGKTW